MALFNEILVGRYNRALQKLLGLKGHPPAPQLSPEIGVTLTPPGGFEELFVWSWETFGTPADQAGVAAVTTSHQLRNPSGSNVIVLIDSMVVTEGNANTLDEYVVSIGQIGTDLASGFGMARRDSRHRLSGSLRVTGGTNAADLAALLAQWTIPAGNSFELISEEKNAIVLLPGDAIRVRNVTVNRRLLATYFWRERFLEEGERQ